MRIIYGRTVYLNNMIVQYYIIMFNGLFHPNIPTNRSGNYI